MAIYQLSERLGNLYKWETWAIGADKQLKRIAQVTHQFYSFFFMKKKNKKKPNRRKFRKQIIPLLEKSELNFEFEKEKKTIFIAKG